MTGRRRVDVVDASLEGQSIARSLRGEGIETREISVEDFVAADASPVVLVAAELPDAPRLLAALERDAPDTVALMLGLPEAGRTAEFPELREDMVFPRPVTASRLVRRVSTLLAPEERRLSVPAESEPTPPERPVEHTMQLSPNTLAGAPSPAATAELRPTTPGDLSGPSVELSVQLAELLRDADRKLFPDLPELDLRVTAGDETARELVPDDLLDAVSVPVDPLEQEDEGPDAFTFFGPPPDAALTPSPGGTGSSSAVSHAIEEERPGGTPHTVPEAHVPRSGSAPLSGSVTVDYFDLGEPVAGSEGRQGDLHNAEALGVLFRLWERRLTVRVTLSPAGGAPSTLELRDGRAAAYEGSPFSRVAADLKLPVDDPESASHEESAHLALQAFVRAGDLAHYELDRRVTAARREELMRSVTAEAGTYLIETPPTSGRLPEPDRAAVFRGSLPSLLLEAARRHIAPERLDAAAGEAGARLELLGGAHRIFRAAEVEPEIVRALERNDGVDAQALAAALPSQVGAAGLLLSLAQMGALRLSRERGRASRDTPFSDGAILRAQARALNGDYFHILGVAPDATSAELSAAYARRLAELGAPRALLEQEPKLAAALRDALAGLEEALRVLRVDSLRARYRAASR